MRNRLTGIAAVALATLATTTAGAGEVSQQDAAEIMDIETLDEVVVTGRLDTLSGLRAAVIAAEDRFYARWNEVNDDNRLDVYCRVEAPTGTRLERRRCDAKMVDDHTRDEALALFDTIEANISVRSTQDIRREAAFELKQRTLAMLALDPELRLALLQRARLEEMYDALRKEKFRSRFFVWD